MWASDSADSIDGGLCDVTIDRAPNSIALELALLCVAALGIGFVALPSDPDLWFHLAGGERMLATGGVPQRDPFSFTCAEELWVPHSWLFDVAIVVLCNALGPRAAEAAFATIFMLAIAICFSMATRRGVAPATALALCLGLALACGNTRGLRPQVLSLACFSALLALLDQARQSRGWTMVGDAVGVGLLFLFWAQAHAACVMGVVAIGVWTFGRVLDAWLIRRTASRGAERCRPIAGEIGRLLAALIVAGLTILITPHAITHYDYVRLTMGLEFLRTRVAEWRPVALLSLQSPDLFLNALTLLAAGALWARRERITWAAALLAGSMIALAWTSARHIPLACVACVPLLADALSTGAAGCAGRVVLRPAGMAVTGIAVAGVLAALWHYPEAIEQRYRKAEPVNGAAALASMNRPLRVLTTYNTGAFVAWRAPDRLKVAVDSRADVYGDALLGRIDAAVRWRDGGALLREIQPDAVVIERGDALAAHLAGSGEWSLLAEDVDALTFVRMAAPQ